MNKVRARFGISGLKNFSRLTIEQIEELKRFWIENRGLTIAAIKKYDSILPFDELESIAMEVLATSIFYHNPKKRGAAKLESFYRQNLEKRLARIARWHKKENQTMQRMPVRTISFLADTNRKLQVPSNEEKAKEREREIEAQIIQEGILARIRPALSLLPALQLEMLIARYGLEKKPPESTESLAKRYGLSKTKTMYFLKRALRNVRRLLKVEYSRKRVLRKAKQPKRQRRNKV